MKNNNASEGFSDPSLALLRERLKQQKLHREGATNAKEDGLLRDLGVFAVKLCGEFETKTPRTVRVKNLIRRLRRL